MRLRLLLSAASVPALLLMTGCGMGSFHALDSNTTSSPSAAAITGRAFGGQSPITGAAINIYAVGRGGYGSDATMLASTTTDSSGNFAFPANAYTCPTPDAPVYLLSVGGNTGTGVNVNAVIGAGIGRCSQAPSTYTVINEVSTAALAFSLSHFFTPTLGTASTDSFGGPANGGSGYSTGLSNAIFYQIPLMENLNVGTVNTPANGAIDSGKIYTIANILAGCVDSTGLTSTTDIRSACGKLFRFTTSSGGTRPTDTLQAAVQMALNPTQSVSQLFALAPAQPAFMGGLGAAPNDWTIGISFVASNMGLSVDSGTVSTIDIDATGRVWFPSNTVGAIGAAYFDPSTASFDGPFNSGVQLHPEQVAIDFGGSAWLNDTQGSMVAGYNTADPTVATTLTMPFTFTTSLTIGYDNTVDYGVGSLATGTYSIGAVSPDRSTYTSLSSTKSNQPFATLAGDTVGGAAAVAENLPNTSLIASYLNPQPPNSTGGLTRVVSNNDNTGQVIFTGNDFITVRSYAGTGNAVDGLCIYSQQACYKLVGGNQLSPIGMAIDGGGALWLADSAGASVQVIYPQISGTSGLVYLNTNNVAPNSVYMHGSGQGGTMTTPYGIAVDNSGNVWVSNAGCTTTTCVPGSFVLSEIVGAATPTITPISQQIAGDGALNGTEPTQ